MSSADIVSQMPGHESYTHQPRVKSRVSKLPSSCAVCISSEKGINWYCFNSGRRRIPCRRGALPVPPKWCPKRNKEATHGKA